MNETALTINDTYADTHPNAPEPGFVNTPYLLPGSDCGCKKEAKSVPSVNGDFRVTAQLSKEEFLLKMLDLLKYSESIGLHPNSISINQW